MTHRIFAVVALASAISACGSDSTGPGTGSGGSVGTGGAGTGASSGSGGTSGSAAGGAAGGDAGGFGGTDASAGTGGVAGGDGGADGSAGTGGTGGQPQVCSPSTTTCSGLDVTTCKADGSGWTTTSTCPFVCSNGACTGTCKPGSNQCAGNGVQTCDGSGTWQGSQTCPFVCSAGACAGTCVPGSKQCSGQAAQTCNANGNWQTDQTCPILCSAGACTGACTPGTKQCSGTTTQTCNGAGQWQDLQTCPYVCAAGSCTGSCVPGTSKCTATTPETCNASGAWVAGSACPFVCSNGSCSGVCVPLSKQCSGTNTQTCDGSGQWGSTTACPGALNANPICTGAGVCGTTCQSGFADCDTSPGCEANLASPTTCGSCSNQCPSQNGTATCSNGSCGISCNQGYADCTSAAGCETQLGTTANCLSCGNSCPTAPANATAVCTGTGCGFACNPTWGDCDNNPGNGCEQAINADPQNCGACGHVCYGGTCSNGVCSQTVEKVAGNSINPMALALDPSNVYFGGAVGTPPTSFLGAVAKTGGAVTTLYNQANAGGPGPYAHTLVTDGTRVYWVAYDPGTTKYSIRAVPVGGGSVTTLVGNLTTVSEIATDGAYVYHAPNQPLALATCYSFFGKTQGPSPIPAQANTDIYEVPVGGGAATKLVTVLNSYVSGLLFADSKLYAMECRNLLGASGQQFYDARLVDINTTSGVVTFDVAAENPDVFTVSGNYLYVREYGFNYKALDKRTLGTGTVLTLSVSTSPKTLATDGSNVYYDFDSTGAGCHGICKVSVNGGAITEVAGGQHAITALQVDATHVYWTADGFDYNNDGTLDLAAPGVYRALK